MITIPKAGVVAGQSAQLQVGVDQSGAALSGLGDRMMQLGHQWRVDKINRETRKAQLGITQDMAMLRMEVDQIGDPSQIGPTWDAGVAEIRQRYVSEDQDPLLRENIGFAIDDLAGQHTTALAGRVVQISQSQDRADFADFAETATKAAGGADEETYAALKAQGLARIDDMQASGQYSPEEAQKARSSLLSDLAGQRAAAAIEADPEAALAALDKGQFGDLTAEAQTAARNAAKAGIAARAKAAEVKTAQSNEAITKQLAAIADMTDTGNPVQGMAFLSDPQVLAAVAADPKAAAQWNRAQASVALQADMPGIQTMTPAEFDAAIAAEAARPKDPSKPWDVNRLEVLRSMRDKMAKTWASDPIAAAATAGLTAPNALEFDPGNPQAFASGLADRLSLSSALRAQGYTQNAQPFTVEERTQLKVVLDPKADTASRLALAQAAVAGAGANWNAAATAMGVTEEMRGAMRVLAETGDAGLAGQILSGEQKIATDMAAAPPPAQMRAAFAAVTGGMFDRDPAAASALMKASAAAFAEVAPPVDPNGLDMSLAEEPLKSIYSDILQRMTGATPGADGKLTVGGLQDINGAPVLLPQGVSQTSAQEALDTLGTIAGRTIRVIDPGAAAAATVAAIPGVTLGGFDVRNPAPKMVVREDPDLTALWASASLTGKSAPELTEDAQDYMATLRLRPVPGQPDLFFFEAGTDGRFKPVVNRDDPARPYVFRLKDLIAGADRLRAKPQAQP